MALRKHQNLLPAVFQTPRNEKFLNATLDQLNSEPNNVKINQYIGRKSSRNFTVGDSYVNESTPQRQNYQLEPAVVYRNSAGVIENVSGLVDGLNAVRFNGGVTTDQNSLTSQKYYNYEGWVDIDKMINYGEYFWLPKGPDLVNVGGSIIDPEATYVVNRSDTEYRTELYDSIPYDSQPFAQSTIDTSSEISYYTFDKDADENPVLYLARGGTYEFEVNQPGTPFWIQTEIGNSGISTEQRNVSTREVQGVVNNGEDIGTVTFNVPESDGQSFYQQLPFVDQEVWFATDYTYSQIHNAAESVIVAQGGIDFSTDFDGKTLVFATTTDDVGQWEQGSPYDGFPYDDPDNPFDETSVVPINDRYAIYRIDVVDIGGTNTIQLTKIADIPQFNKVKVKQGVKYGSRELYKNAENKLELIPPMTAGIDTLYYQDGANANIFGRIELVDIGSASTINVDKDIIGQSDYTAPNDVKFTNGLKIELDSTVLPEVYQNRRYYVEGVGQPGGICLVPEEDLSTPESFTNSLLEGFDEIGFDAGNYDGTEFAPTDADYILMNRACKDNNSWSRYNRWFHKSVIEASAAYNDFTVSVDQNQRAKRPIIEFKPGLSLWNHGTDSKQPVDIFDTSQTDALSNVNGTLGYFADGIDLDPQHRIIFSADLDKDVRNTVYRVEFIDPDDVESTDPIISLVPVETITEGDSVLSKFGLLNQGKMFHYKNDVWLESQQRTSLFQEPLFDVYDGNHKSLGDSTVYPGTDFAGSKLFNYKRNANVASDSVLGFGLTYKNFNNIGDIVFENYFITDKFQYTKASTGKPVNVIVKSGHAHSIDYNTGNRQIVNGWREVVEESKQYQVVRNVVVNELYTFEIGAEPAASQIQNLKVYVNGAFIPPTQYTRLLQNNKWYVVFDSARKVNDNVIIKVYSTQQNPIGFYEVPVNLENNANNNDFESLTLGQARNHMIEMAENIPQLDGGVLGSNNLRDIDSAKFPGKILQHSSGSILPLHLLSADQGNIIDSIKFSSAEYTRFKNRFIDNLDKLDLDLRNAPESVDAIIEELVGAKTSLFPFYYSDMSPWGERKTLYSYTLDNTVERFFEFGTQFDLADLSQRGVLVYLTNSNRQKQQLLYGRDYTFDTQVAGITLTKIVNLAIGDVLDIVEYDNTDGSFIPPTPTKLGLWPKWEPSVYVEEVFGYEDTEIRPWKIYGTLDPEYTQIGGGLIGFTYPLYTSYEAAEQADTSGMVHIHKFLGTDRLFYMPGSAGKHGAQDDSTIDYYPGARSIIRGHDGSRYVGFQDIRDSLIVELESRIYNNIKTDYDKELFDWSEVLTGYSRNTRADQARELDVLRGSFGTWCEKNRVDPTTNTTFETTNKFSWNYSLAQDSVKGQRLPGGWRGIFNWLYDTDSPHLTPWEMLGIYQKPSWWDQRYGLPPYTSGNLVMWEDLRDGKLYTDAVSNEHTVIETRKRPDLLSFVPVDIQGHIRAPADFVGRDINVTQANNPWVFGDWSPQETAWRHSSEWPFAAQILAALKKPAKYISLLWDANLYVRDADLNQIVQRGRTYRPTLGDYCLHGVADENGTINRREGYNQFIFNYLLYYNFNTKDVETKVRNLELNLCYKLEGFSDKKFLKVIAETATPNTSNNSIFIPDEDYDIFLGKSVPLERVVYSGVRIIKERNGYKISGYDTTNPFFKVIPTNRGTNSSTFSVGGEQFTVFKDGQTYVLNIPYGTVLTTKGQVVDFLNSLQRYYNDRGIQFDKADAATTVNFESAAQEFVFWTQQNWNEGSVFTVSPAYNGISVNRPLTTIDDMSRSITVRDVNGKPIDKQDYRVSRIDSRSSIDVNSASALMASAVLSPIQYEHIIVFNNTTIFNDLIYDPSLGNRQERLKLVGEKTGNWNGTLHAPGYIISNDTFDLWIPNKSYVSGDYVSFRNKLFVANQNHIGVSTFDYEVWDELVNYKSGLLKNIVTKSTDFEKFFDTDEINLEGGVDKAGKGLIGFRNREWLENLGLDDVSQVKFYQGMLKEKGTPSVINKLINADLTNLNQEIDFFEEWGFRIGEYGSNESNQVIDINIDEVNGVNNPITVQLIDDNEEAENPQNLAVKPDDLLRKPNGYTKNLWKTRTSNTHKHDLDIVGYPRIDDVDYTVVDIEFLKDLEQDLENLGRGDKIWVGREYGTWNVYRVNETESYVTSVNNVNPGFLTIVTDVVHNVNADDIVLIKTDDFFGGFYRVDRILTSTQFQVRSDVALPDVQEVDISVPIYKLETVRYKELADIGANTPKYGFFKNEMVWVDSDEKGRWAAYEKNLPWSQNDPLTSTDVGSGKLGTSVALSTNESIALAGAPDAATSGRVLHYKIVDGKLTQSSIMKYPTNAGVLNYGGAIASGNQYHVIGASKTESAAGAAFIYARDKNDDLDICQVLQPVNSANREFGHSIAISYNENYIVVGAPGANIAYVYAKRYIDPANNKTKGLTGDGATSTWALGFTPYGTYSILVQSATRPYIPNVDYSVSGANIIFTTPLAENVSITQKTHYVPTTTIVGSDVQSGDNFGHTVDIDEEGRTIVVGSPYADIADSSSVLQTDAGEVYVFANTVEAYTADGTSKTYNTTNIPTAGPIVTVDSEQYIQVDANTLAFQTEASELNNYKVVGNSVTFSYKPTVNSIIRVYTGVFKEVQQINQSILSGNEPTDSENFGISVAINTYGSAIAIGSPGEDETNPNTGSVFVFMDSGLRFGTVDTETTLHTVDYFEDESIFINDYEVSATADDTDVRQFIADVTSANLAGISATERTGATHQATISTTAIQPNKKLRIRPGTGAMFDKIAVAPFKLVQQINHPSEYENENFGLKVAFDKYVNANTVNSQNLLVGSDKASTLLPVGFDKITDTNDPDAGLYGTTFDADGTLFIDRQTQSGAAYVYEFTARAKETVSNLPSWLFSQSMTANEIDEMDEFGSAIAYNHNRILIGSRLDDESGVTDSGSVYEFSGDGTKSWAKKREQVDKVDITLFNKNVTYNKDKQEIITFADYIDPYKLKIAGAAQQEIDYLTDFDPASYSTASSNGVSLRPNSPWGKNHVGRVWWDLTSAMFIEYEQGELDYRTQYWGRLFPGAEIVCYEWVESATAPTEYTGDGTPRSFNEYSEQILYDPATNTTRTRYFFWVNGKESVPSVNFRTMSTNAVERLITDPTARGVKHIQYIAPNALNMVNFSNDLDDDNTVLSINYDRVANEGILHSEFELVSKGDPLQIIPTRIYNKIVDSVSGIDVKENVVPNPVLSDVDKYGIGIRPRQTIYRNRFKALQVFVDYCNQQFVNFPVVREATVANNLSSQEQEPTTASGLWNKRVANTDELGYLNTGLFDVGYKILVTTDSTAGNRWTIYTLQADKTWSKTRTQSYKTSEQWEYKDWYAPGFNEFTVPLYQVGLEPDLLSLTNATAGEVAKVLTNDDGNSSFYEKQTNGTWKEVIIGKGTIQFKTSLYTDYNSASTDFPSNEARGLFNAVKDDIFLDDKALLLNELFFRLVEYALDEYGIVHPDWVFKSSFIRVSHKLRELDQYPTFRNDNSDFVETFINEVKPYKTKIRDYTTRFDGDDLYDGDATDFDVHAFFDTNLQYFRKPSGDYSGDEITRTQGLNVPWSQNYTYYIDELYIQNGGTGYIQDPTVTISAPDVKGGVQARAIARTNGSSIIAVEMLNKGTGYTTLPTVTITGGSGVDLFLIPRLKNDVVREFDVTLKFDRITYSSTVKDWTANTAYAYQDLITYKNATTGEQEVYQVSVTGGFTSGATFSAETSDGTVALTVYDDALLGSNADRIAAYYNPQPGMIGDDLNLLQYGTDYTGTRLRGAGFDQSPGFDSGTFDSSSYDAFEVDLDGLEVLSSGLIDTNVRSTFTDSLLGTRPEDINIDGGKFVDEHNSNAPEEVVPGIVFDTLDLEVYTDPSDDFEYDGNSFNIVTRAYIGDADTTVYSYANDQRNEDVDVVHVWVGSNRQHDAVIDFAARTVTLSSAPATGVGIYIYGYSLTGEKITHEQVFEGNGTTNSVTLGVGLDTVVQEFVVKNGVKLVKDVDYVVSETNSRTIVTFTQAPAVGDRVNIITSRQDTAREAFTETYTQEITLTAGTQTYALDKTIQYVQPFEGAVIAELGDHRLRPTNGKHYTADGSTVTYSIPTTAGEGAIADGDIRVSVISPDDRSTLLPVVNKSVNIDFTIDASDGSSARTITFFDPPSTGDTIIVSVRTGAEFQLASDSITLTSDVTFDTGDKLFVTSFANHDPIRPQTQVFIGLGSDIATDDELFDESEYDSTGFDETAITGVSVATYSMDRAISKTDYLWITLDGVKLHPGDFAIDQFGKLDLSAQTVTSASEIIVTSFSENIIQPTVGFRIFKDMLGGINYYRICDDESTELAQDVDILDTKIYVKDASKLVDADVNGRYPGVVFIGNERITYWEKNDTDNYITNLRRSTRGTRYASVHSAGTAVIDASEQNRMPATDTHTKTWYDNGTNTASNGNGIQSSSTINSKFLKKCQAVLQDYT